jgi:hypothetical protein
VSSGDERSFAVFFKRKQPVVGRRNIAAVVVLKVLYRLVKLFGSRLGAPVRQAEPGVRCPTCSELFVFRVSATLRNQPTFTKLGRSLMTLPLSQLPVMKWLQLQILIWKHGLYF